MSLLGRLFVSSARKMNSLNEASYNMLTNQLLAYKAKPEIRADMFYSKDNKKLPGDKKWSELTECQKNDCPADVARMDDVMPPMKNHKPPWQKPPCPCEKPPEPKKFTCADEPVKDIPRRPRKKIYSSSSCKNPSPSKDAQCDTFKSNKCKKIQLPGCVRAKQPPKCVTHQIGRQCTKPKAPLPSFSECLKDPLKKSKITECNCLKKPGVCKK